MTSNVNIHRKKSKHFYSLMTADDNINQLIKELETHLTDKKAHFWLTRSLQRHPLQKQESGDLNRQVIAFSATKSYQTASR